MIYDVAIAGSGPAGSVAAYFLAQKGLRVALLDIPNEQRPKIGESLPAATKILLQKIGLSDIVLNVPSLESVGNWSAWNSDEIYSRDSLSSPYGNGFHVDRNQFDSVLREKAIAMGAEFYATRVQKVTKTQDSFQIKTKLGEIYSYFLIDATGRSASIARRLGAKKMRDDNLVALYQFLQNAADTQPNVTLIEACPVGWWYACSLPDHRSIVSLQLDLDHAKLLRNKPQLWLSELEKTKHIRKMTNGITFTPKPQLTEACGSRLDHCMGQGWLAVGDAAMAFDPLSSQGMYNAIYSGFKGGSAVFAYLNGNTTALEEYAERLDAIREAYLLHHRYFYRTETRWKTEDFWRRRYLGVGSSSVTPLRERLISESLV